MKFWKPLFIFLLLVISLLVLIIYQLPDDNLHVIACDVGQGDGLLTIYKNIQILTDGGPDKKILNCLGKHLPFWDRNIELVISTHPDADHVTGLVDVIKRYKVNKIIINPIDPGTPIYQLLKKEVGSRGVRVINPVDSLSLRLDLIQLDLLNPNNEQMGRLTTETEDDKLSKYQVDKETNLYSIVYTLSFGKFNGMFLGDIPIEVSNQLAVSSAIVPVHYIKIPHHGSKNGLTQGLLEKLVPGSSSKTVALISVGAKNMWGFPSSEILKMLSDKNVKVLRTDLSGDVTMSTDGEKIWWKK